MDEETAYSFEPDSTADLYQDPSLILADAIRSIHKQVDLANRLNDILTEILCRADEGHPMAVTGEHWMTDAEKEWILASLRERRFDVRAMYVSGRQVRQGEKILECWKFEVRW